MKTLVFGGSFDPPHRGHAALLRAAAKRVRPDRILVVPACHAPLKAAPSAPAAARAELARLGVLKRLPSRWRRIARIDMSEARAQRPVHTVETLSRLKALDPDGEFHFVCGQDAAASFSKWKDPTRLKRLATWWYGPRPGKNFPTPPHFRKLAGRLPDISSTELRSALALGEDCSNAVYPEVLAEARRLDLYNLDLLDSLKKTLSPSRCAHTLNVAALASALARRHGADSGQARLAGLLHDNGRRMSIPRMAEYSRKRRLKVPQLRLTADLQPLLLHAHISEDLARREFGVTDLKVLSAIRKHTLGDPEMGLLDRLIYVADACAFDRRHHRATATRALAFTDLDAALKRCVADNLSHALARGSWLHPLTISLWNRLAAR